MKKAISFILALMLLASAVMMPSCEKKTSDNFPDVSSDVESESSPEETEPQVPVVNFEITPEVKVVYSVDAPAEVLAAAEALVRSIRESLGFECEIITDEGDRLSPEIMVGECGRREDSVAFNGDLYGYGYEILSDTAVNISAHETENVYRAVKLFTMNVVEKNITLVPVGGGQLNNNEKPKVAYSINSQPLESFVIVCDDPKEPAAESLKKYFDEYLFEKINIVGSAEYVDGNAIKIGNFGMTGSSYGYKISSSVESGKVTITLDGESAAVRETAAEVLKTGFFVTDKKEDNFVIPESLCGYGTMYNGTGLYQVSSESKELAEGVTYYRKHYNNAEGNNVDVFITVVSGDSSAQLGVYVADFDTKSGKEKLDVKTVGTLAGGLQATGVNVLAACNAGYFHKSAKTNYPYGMQIVNGEEIWAPDGSLKLNADNWVGVTFEGELVSGTAKDYESTYRGKLEYGVACGAFLIQNGKLNTKRMPAGVGCCTTVALTADGGFVIICVDGRPENGNGTSAGCSDYDMVTLLWDLGLEYTNAYVLDGGGSTEMVIENGAGFRTQNSPSDTSEGKRGVSREVSDIIAVIIK